MSRLTNMMLTKPFLTAEWRKLINITYKVPPEPLTKYCPPGVSLDVIDDHAFVSLVAFDFLNTKVKGIKIPFHVNFPEINLRFYVKFNDIRGVVFVKEFVPRFFIATTAKYLYNEPYEAIPVKSAQINDNSSLESQYSLKKAGDWQKISIRGRNEPFYPPTDGDIHYFKEHEWGFGQHNNITKFYRVEHPIWEIYPVISWKLKFDFNVVYGAEWSFLNDRKPDHVIYAEGSRVSVYPNVDLTDF